jgi:ubiquinone/menaquinone biosynthesis C-methylase UbiE
MIALGAEKAQKLGTDQVRFILGDSTHLAFGNASVDIITCSQSFHWMEPQASLTEFHRVLASGGVFAALDCDWPPSIGREAEQLYESMLANVEKIAFEKVSQSRSRKWPKEKHLANIRASGLFRFSKEIVFHNTEQCDAERFIAIAISQGQVQSLLKVGVTEAELGLHAFREGVRRSLGQKLHPLYVSYRMQLAVK